MDTIVNKHRINCVVVGAGSIGTYLSCKLSRAGFNVRLKLRNSRDPSTQSRSQRNVDALCANDGVKQFSRWSEIRSGVDYLFLTTKTFDYGIVGAELSFAKIKPRVIVALHNGIVKYPFQCPVVHAVIPQSYDIVSSECGCPSRSSFVVRNEDKPWHMADSKHAREAVKICNMANIAAVADGNYESELLRKYFINGVANCLSVVADCNCGELLERELPRMQKLFDEMHAVLRTKYDHLAAQDHDLKGALHDKVFAGLASFSSHSPSTKHDFDNGRPLELRSLNGYVQDLGREVGVLTPHTDQLMVEVEAMVEARDAAASEAKRAAATPAVRSIALPASEEEHSRSASPVGSMRPFSLPNVLRRPSLLQLKSPMSVASSDSPVWGDAVRQQSSSPGFAATLLAMFTGGRKAPQPI